MVGTREARGAAAAVEVEVEVGVEAFRAVAGVSEAVGRGVVGELSRMGF